MTPNDCIHAAQVLGDHFVCTQSAYGRPDPRKTVFARRGPFTCGSLHSPPFIARALYRLYDFTGVQTYLGAADRYVAFLLAVIRNSAGDSIDWYRDQFTEDSTPDVIREHRDLLARSWMYGLALDNYAEFRVRHPGETCFCSKAEAVYRWLDAYRWSGSKSPFRVGYAKSGFEDNGFSDDLCHVGRGLVQYYRQCEKSTVLQDAIDLADYFLGPITGASDTGVFNEDLGTWAVGPWPVVGFEHMENASADAVGWGFSARGVTDFLLRLHPFVDKGRQSAIKSRTTASLKWQIEKCQFEDGAFGMFARDDKWLGMTAGALLTYSEMKDCGFFAADLPAGTAEAYERGRDWFLSHATRDFGLKKAGYEEVTGHSDASHRENAAWLLAWSIECLLQLSTNH